MQTEADPDPAYHFDAYPNACFQFDADPCESGRTTLLIRDLLNKNILKTILTIL